MKAKILILDIETAPNVAYVWRYFKTMVGAKQVIERGYMISFAAKWLGEDKVYYADTSNQKEIGLLKDLLPLLDEADMVVAHNGERFDLPQIRGRYLENKMPPPSPVKVVDTFKIAKKEFGFPSNSLEYLTDTLCDIKKSPHKKFPGFLLWLEVLKNNPEAWAEMKAYNIDDILSLEELYLKMRPYARFHPNVAVFNDEGNEAPACPKCGGQHLHKRGYAYTNVGKYQRFRCNDCGGWSKSRKTLVDKKLGQNVTTNLVN